jgi:hypothetical protein
MKPLSSDEIIRTLLKDGFYPRGKSGGGSHQVYKKRYTGWYPDCRGCPWIEGNTGGHAAEYNETGRTD